MQEAKGGVSSSPTTMQSNKWNPDTSPRARVRKACQRCKVKKTKCDGLYPCERCKDADEVCLYRYDDMDDCEDNELDTYYQ